MQYGNMEGDAIGECLNKKYKVTRKKSENSEKLWQAHGFMTVAVSK